MKAGGQGQRFSLLLNRLFGLRENYLAIDMAPETIPVFALGDDRYEYRFPRGESSFVTRISRAADAANFSMVGIQNPPNSGIFVVVESVMLDLGAAVGQTLITSVRRGVQIGGSIGFAAATDGRALSNDSGVDTFNNVEAAILQQDGDINPTGGVIVPHFAALPPNSCFVLETTAINTAIPITNIRGYWRPCRPDEMT